MNHLSSWVLTRFFAVTLLAGVLAGCTIYNTQPPPPPPPAVVYVPQPTPPAEETPPPPPEEQPAPAPVVVVEIHDDSDFYEPLSPYGQWVDVNGYGRCWTPAGVDRDWHPYTQGHWCRTDAGWYWESDEPWGWATCHYGRWLFDPALGWVWVPQTQWAPAWVAWRDGGGYTGWAPLPPQARFRPDGYLERPDDDIDPHSYVFVEQRHMLEPQRPQTVIVNNITVVQQTVNVTKIVVVNKTVVNEGPSIETIARATGHPVNTVAAPALRAQHEAPVIARDHDHLRTATLPGPVSAAALPRPGPPGNGNHNPRPNAPVQPQQATASGNPARPPEQVRTPVQPNQPRPPLEQPAPRPPVPEQTRNNQNHNPHSNVPKPHEPGLNQPGNQPPLSPDHRRVEPGQPIQEANKPEHPPVPNPPQVHKVPSQPKPEPNPAIREPVPHGNEPGRPSQPPVPSQPPQHQPPHEQEKPRQAGEKLHPEEPKNRHSSTNAPPRL